MGKRSRRDPDGHKGRGKGYATAHGWGLTVDDLHRCVDEAVQMVNDDERITCDVPWLSSLNEGPRAGRPWLRRLQPIEAVES